MPLTAIIYMKESPWVGRDDGFDFNYHSYCPHNNMFCVLRTYVTNSFIWKGTVILTHKIKLIDDDNDPLLFTNDIDIWSNKKKT